MNTVDWYCTDDGWKVVGLLKEWVVKDENQDEKEGLEASEEGNDNIWSLLTRLSRTSPSSPNQYSILVAKPGKHFN